MELADLQQALTARGLTALGITRHPALPDIVLVVLDGDEPLMRQRLLDQIGGLPGITVLQEHDLWVAVLTGTPPAVPAPNGRPLDDER